MLKSLLIANIFVYIFKIIVINNSNNNNMDIMEDDNIIVVINKNDKKQIIEGIYLIHTREFVNSKKKVYKLGSSRACAKAYAMRSGQIFTRFFQYPKESVMKYYKGCNNSHKCERELIEIFKTKFIYAIQYGNEYFIGDVKEMIKVINNHIEKNYPIYIDVNNKKEEINDNKDDIIKIKDINNDNKEEVHGEIKINDNNKENIYKCVNCNKIFKYNSLYQKHLNNKKPFQNNEDNNQNINIINRKYANITQLISDKNKKSVINKCYFCDKEFSTKGNLIKHKKASCKNYKELILKQQYYRELINKLKNKDNEIAKLKEEIIKLKEINNNI
jgi:uncharacterized C2H2 Zn-finger protein